MSTTKCHFWEFFHIFGKKAHFSIIFVTQAPKRPKKRPQTAFFGIRLDQYPVQDSLAQSRALK